MKTTFGFVSARSVWKNGEELWTDPGLGRLIDELSLSSPLVVALSSMSRESKPELYNHRIDHRRIQFFPLPYLPSVSKGFFKSRSCRSVIREVEKACAATLIQLPFASVRGLDSPSGARLYQICADLYRQVETSPYYSGPRGWIALPMARWIDRIQKRICRRSETRVVTHGQALFDRYGTPGKGRAIVSSALSTREMGRVRRQREPDGVFRLLFVGYLRHEKGCDVLLKALSAITERGKTVELWVVGGRDKNPKGVEAEMASLIESLGLQSRIHRVGAVPWGPELFQKMADSDALLLPSRSEGTPRVLVEARAMGCPVIASRVGGVVDSVKDHEDGLLFEVGNYRELAEKVIYLIDNPGSKLELIEKGRQRVRGWTVEGMARSLMDELKLLLNPERC